MTDDQSWISVSTTSGSNNGSFAVSAACATGAVALGELVRPAGAEGVELIGRVPPTLHTPLMSCANAVSGITVVGALIIAGSGLGWISNVLGFIAIVLAMMNVAGGYAVTDRMLGMFKARSEEKR